MSQIIGIGTEIVECLRIARMIERHGELFINRVYTAEEIRYCRRPTFAAGYRGETSKSAPSRDAEPWWPCAGPWETSSSSSRWAKSW